MNEEGPDPWRGTRRGIAQIVILFDMLFFLGPASVLVRLITTGRTGLTDDSTLRAAWLLGTPLLAWSFVLAVRVLRTTDRAAGWRVTGRAAAVFAGGAVLIVATSALRGVDFQGPP